MKGTFILVLGLIALLPAVAFCAEPAAEAKTSGESSGGMSVADKVSYSLGNQMGTNLKRNGVDIAYPAFLQGVQDALDGKEPALTEDEMRACLTEFQQQMIAKRQQEREKEAVDNLAEEQAFLAENAKKEGVVTLPSGVQYKVVAEGTGPTPKPEDRIQVHYRGRFADGAEFDSSYKRDKPAEFFVNRVIAGWTEALQIMNVGAKWEIYIPAALAYGDRGRPNIGPNKMLIFEVELLQILPSVQIEAPAETVGDGTGA